MSLTSVKISRHLFAVLLSLSFSVVSAQDYIKAKNTDCKVYVYANIAERAVDWTGSCQEGYAEGEGTLTVFQKDTFFYSYTGVLKKGRLYKGTATYFDKTYVKTRWDSLGQRYGYSEMSFADGEWRSGEYDDISEGKGFYTRGRHDTISTGNFSGGELHNTYSDAPAVIKFPNGNSYKGVYYESSLAPFERGEYIFANGDTLDIKERTATPEKYSDSYIKRNGAYITFKGVLWGKGTSYEIRIQGWDEQYSNYQIGNGSWYLGFKKYYDSLNSNGGPWYYGALKGYEPFGPGIMMLPDGNSYSGYFYKGKLVADEEAFLKLISPEENKKELFAEAKRWLYNPSLSQLCKSYYALLSQIEPTNFYHEHIKAITKNSNFNFDQYLKYASTTAVDSAVFYQRLKLLYQYDFYPEEIREYCYGKNIKDNHFLQQIYSDSLSITCNLLSEQYFISGSTDISMLDGLFSRLTDPELQRKHRQKIALLKSDYYYSRKDFEKAEMILLALDTTNIFIDNRLLRIYEGLHLYTEGDVVFRRLADSMKYVTRVEDPMILYTFFNYAMVRDEVEVIKQYGKYLTLPVVWDAFITDTFYLTRASREVINSGLIHMKYRYLDMDSPLRGHWGPAAQKYCATYWGDRHQFFLEAEENCLMYNLGLNVGPGFEGYLADLPKIESLLALNTKYLEELLPAESETLMDSYFKKAEFFNSQKLYKKSEAYYQLYQKSKTIQLNQIFPSLSSYMQKAYYFKFQQQSYSFYTFCYEGSGSKPGHDKEFINNNWAIEVINTGSYAGKKIEYNAALTGMFYDDIINHRGYLLHSQKNFLSSIRESSDTILLRKYERLLEYKKQFALYAYYSSEELKLNHINLDELRNQIRTLEGELSAAVNAPSQELPDQKSWKKIQSVLKTGQASIEIIKANDGELFDYYVLYLDSKTTKQPLLIRLSSDSLKDSKLYKYYRNLMSLKKEDLKTYEVIWKRIDSLLQQRGINTVYFSGEGIYNLINIQTLFNPKTKKYTIDTYKILQVSSTWLVADKKMFDLLGPFSSAVLIGNPEFGNPGNDEIQKDFIPEPVRSLEISRGKMKFGSLPGTEKEIEKISAQLKSKGVNCKVYEGAQAQESVLRDMQPPSVLHISTHGFYLSNVSEYDAMLYSGLAMAGISNGSHSESDNDGILTAYEVQNLKLQNTQLVVLSACETGTGENVGSEGVYGLKRAFLIAGANYVITSLWKVDDEATQLLMSDFYKRLGESGDVYKAWNESQQSMRIAYPHPYYWGAFVITR